MYGVAWGLKAFFVPNDEIRQGEGKRG